jgi:hypothetical protein
MTLENALAKFVSCKVSRPLILHQQELKVVVGISTGHFA